MSRIRTRWTGGLAALVLCLICLAGVPVLAAEAPAPSAAPAAPTATEPAPAAATGTPAEQLEAMVSTLEDPAARAKLVEQLKTLVAAQKGQLPAAPVEENKGVLADVIPDTLGARTLAFLSDRVAGVSQLAARTGEVFGDLPRIGEWAQRQFEDSTARERWVQLGISLTMILIAGVVVARFAGWLLSRPRRAIEARRYPRTLQRLPFLLLRAALALVPIAVFALVGYGVLTLAEPGPRVRLVVIAIINASVIVQAVMVAADFLFAPTAPGLRLLRIRDETAVRACLWVRRLAAAAVFGYFIAEGAYVLGLPLGAYGAVLKLLGVLIAGMLVALILQNRASVAEWLRGNPLSGDGDVVVSTQEREAEGQGAVLRSARRRFADVWHVLAIVYVAVAFAAWMLNVYEGFEYLARATVLSMLVFIVARLLVNGINRVLHRGVRLSARMGSHLPHVEDRARLYVPVLHRVAKFVIWVTAVLLILNAWGIDSLAWTDTQIGRRALRSVLTISLILGLSILAWEVVSALIERFLATTDQNGTRIERSARMRTLLPLLRNAFMVLLVTMVSLISLAELGVNIAPLLAGAGVVGLAVGFGSQTLVKDVITGLFILFEDTISVGDVVDVGGGHSGVVEAISIRTIRLRDQAGAVHSVPFSAVTTVKNLTKDFSFAVFDVSVGYAEDPDRVCGVLKEIGAAIQADPLFAPDILEPLEVMGVDRLADSGIVLKARFKTRPLKQWNVGREFNKRLKNRFGELGISIPYPHMQLVMAGGGDRSLGEVLSQGS
ncbi:MAG TPA: mechanosensitive ion channel domain-containing protein [Azospirillum sp.]